MIQATLRLATPTDSEALGVIGPAAYSEAYGGVWADVRGQVKHLYTFGERAFSELLSRPDVVIWLAEIDQTPVGFASLFLGLSNPITGETGGAKLDRLYVLSTVRRSGLGKSFMGEIDAFALRQGLSHVWLDVLESADWARDAYRRWGFSELGRINFPGPVKAGLEPMRVLRKPVPRA